MNALQGLFFTTCAHLFKLASGFILIKLIAFYLGPEKLGELGHFMSFAAIMFMLAGGGITNGVIKYTAEYQSSPKKLVGFLSASVAYASIFSIIVIIAGIIYCKTISIFVFKDPNLYWLIILLAFAQTGFAFSTLICGATNGFHNTKEYAKIQITGVLLGIPVIYFLIKHGSYEGAALGIIVFYLSNTIPAFLVFRKSKFYRDFFNFKKIKFYYQKLWPFTLMLITTTMAFPVVEIFIREFLIDSSGFSDAGLWQGCIKLSSAYVGFFAVFLGAYYMPMIAKEKNIERIKNSAYRFLAIVMMTFLFGALILIFFKQYFIALFLSEKFLPLNDYIIYQLIGDFFKVSSYVFGYIAVAKAATRIYIAAELFQCTIFLISSMLLSNYTEPLKGVFVGYSLSYIIYFLVAFIFFWKWLKLGSTK